MGRPDQWQGIGIVDLCALGTCNCLTSSSSPCRLCPALCHFPASLAGGIRGRSLYLFVFPWALASGSMQDCGSPTAPALAGLWKRCSTAYPFISRDSFRQWLLVGCTYSLNPAEISTNSPMRGEFCFLSGP